MTIGGAAGTGGAPDAINFDANAIPSTGVLSADLSLAFQNYAGSMAGATLVMHPRTGLQIGLAAGGRLDVGINGGQLAQVPVVCSEACAPIDSDGAATWTLLDASAVCFVDAGASVRAISDGMAEQDGAPAGETSTPTAASATLMGLWQAELVALVVIRRINWHLARPDACVTVTGADYTGS